MLGESPVGELGVTGLVIGGPTPLHPTLSRQGLARRIRVPCARGRRNTKNGSMSRIGGWPPCRGIHAAAHPGAEPVARCGRNRPSKPRRTRTARRCLAVVMFLNASAAS